MGKQTTSCGDLPFRVVVWLQDLLQWWSSTSSTENECLSTVTAPVKVAKHLDPFKLIWIHPFGPTMSLEDGQCWQMQSHHTDIQHSVSQQQRKQVDVVVE